MTGWNVRAGGAMAGVLMVSMVLAAGCARSSEQAKEEQERVMRMAEVVEGHKRQPPPPMPAEIPEAMDQAEAVTLEVVMTLGNGEHAQEVQQVITRTSDRVHVDFVEQGQEWLFVRNPLDGRRATGWLTDHTLGVVLEYQEADLADEEYGRGWFEVMAMGVPAEWLEAMRATGEKVTLVGVECERYVRPGESKSRLPDEMLWDDARQLPMRIVYRKPEGEWRQEVWAIRTSIDEAELHAPRDRYHAYMSMDAVDYREEPPMVLGLSGGSEQYDQGHHHH